jgi:hypothetical protein
MIQFAMLKMGMKKAQEEKIFRLRLVFGMPNG